MRRHTAKKILGLTLISLTFVFLSSVVYAAKLRKSALSTSVPQFDVLSYIVGDPTRFPRSGTHGMNQVVSNNAVWFIKFNDPKIFEAWRWDDQYIYHHEDRSGALDVAWHMQNDIWAKRFMRHGEAISGQGETVFDYQISSGCTLIRTRDHDYTQYFYYHPNYDAGGDIGIADVIELKNDIGSADLTYESFYFAKGWGWFKWEFWDHRNGRTTSPAVKSVFNVLGGALVFPAQPLCRSLPDGSVLPSLSSVRPRIGSISPTSTKLGELLAIQGLRLAPTVQFFDQFGGRTTVSGKVNVNYTQTTVLVPNVPSGMYTVKVYANANSISNGVSFEILADDLPPPSPPPSDPLPEPGPSIPPLTGGRYKLDAQGNCYFDPNDSGPNQCTPTIDEPLPPPAPAPEPTGRYKLNGNGNCYWDPNDEGPDQCTL